MSSQNTIFAVECILESQGKIWPPELLCAIYFSEWGWLEYRCMELYNTNLSVGAAEKALTSFASDKILAEEATESKLTNTGQHLPKRRYRLVYFSHRAKAVVRVDFLFIG